MAQFYTKINTLYKRYGVNEKLGDKRLKNCIILGSYADPNIFLLKDKLFGCSEKINGTNISAHLDYNGGDYKLRFEGKTPSAEIHPGVLAKLKEYFTVEKIVDAFTMNDTKPTKDIHIYGEGFGHGIQEREGSRYIKNGQDFAMFDVQVGDLWLSRESCDDIARKLNIPIAPFIGYMTIDEAEALVRKGFKSKISEDPTLDAEGLVCVAPNGILNRMGDRIITKIKTCDYRKLEMVRKQIDKES